MVMNVIAVPLMLIVEILMSTRLIAMATIPNPPKDMRPGSSSSNYLRCPSRLSKVIRSLKPEMSNDPALVSLRLTGFADGDIHSRIVPSLSIYRKTLLNSLTIERSLRGRVYSLYPGRKLQWFVAQRLCELSQGQLAVPDNEEVYIFIRDMIREYFVKLNISERMDMNGFHLGIRHVDNKWIPSDIDWCSGEPKMQGSCAEFSTLHGFCVNDYNCKEHRKRGIICERPLFVLDQPERGFVDQRVICLKPLNTTLNNGRATWFEADEWCRSMKMSLVHPLLFKDKPCGGLYKRAPTAVNVNSLDGTWNADESIVDWCGGHPLPDRHCGLHFGNCYRSVRCGDRVMQRFCCSALVKNVK